MKYGHVRCKCGGIIGRFDRNNFICSLCGKNIDINKIKYDLMLPNDKTGWIFPMIVQKDINNQRKV